MMKDALRETAEKITKGAKTEREKVEKIWNFVKEKIFYKVTILGDSKKILKERYGSCIDKTILFVDLVRSLGIKARYHIILFDLRPILKKILKEKPEIIKKFSFSSLLLKDSILDKIPLLPHSFPEAFIEGRWVKFNRSFLDKDLEEKVKGGKLLLREAIKVDLGSFEKISEILEKEEIRKLINLAKKRKRIASLIVNKINSYLFFLRGRKNKKLSRKEDFIQGINQIEKLSKCKN